MKCRIGFVSNSSSSSFICDVCGEIESGYDLCLQDAEMYKCRNCGHMFHTDCVKKDDLIELSNNRCNKCPFCDLTLISRDLLYNYATQINPSIFDEMRNKFTSYDEAIKACK